MAVSGHTDHRGCTARVGGGWRARKERPWAG
jgi:hypothetical protein